MCRENTCLLLDAGEGTCGQIVRFYGKGAADIFRKIKAVYISHLHADHHIGTFESAPQSDGQFTHPHLNNCILQSGLFGVIQMRKRLRDPKDLPIILMAPIEINSWLQFYDKNVENICDELTVVPNGSLVSMLTNN